MSGGTTVADYALEGVKWGPSAALGTSGGTVSWSFMGAISVAYRIEIQAAFVKWSSVANIDFIQVADNSAANIELSFSSIDGPGQIIGQATYFYSAGRLTSADVLFDSAETWNATPNGLAKNGAYFEAVALHEIGHAIGIDHYSGSIAVMNPYLPAGINSLTASDIHAAQALYGSASTTVSTMVIQNPVTHQIDFLKFSGENLTASYLTSFSAWDIVAHGDINGDHRIDFVTQSADGQINHLIIDSAGNLVGSLLENGSYWAVHGAGDFDGTDRHSIMTQDEITGQINLLWFSGVDLSESLLLSGSYWRAVGAADINQDGKTDIVTQSAATGEINFLFFQGTRLVGSNLLNGRFDPVESVHVDGANQLDIVTQHATTQAVQHLTFDSTGHLLSADTLPHIAGWNVVNAGGVSDWFF